MVTLSEKFFGRTNRMWYGEEQAGKDKGKVRKSKNSGVVERDLKNPSRMRTERNERRRKKGS